MEQSVATIPSERRGQFLHVSGMTVSADCAQPAQQLNADETAIATEGSRVTSVTVGGIALDDAATYKVVVSGFVGSGGDGHVLLGESPIAVETDQTEHSVMQAYLAANSPVEPTLEGRIQLTAACSAP
jgi:2',3'-cyclic-nucleotide 2'-phosphodiesterase (5'-nucleotidase family)